MDWRNVITHMNLNEGRERKGITVSPTCVACRSQLRRGGAHGGGVVVCDDCQSVAQLDYKSRRA